jgi:putative nucleotidyltransferase with HDIG domain
MSAHALIESERVRESLASGRRRMLAGERRGELIVGAGFVLVAVSLALLGGGGAGISLPIAALYVLSIAAVGYVRFDIGAGFTVPTQAVFVPMLFALPVAWVPLLVALGLALGRAPGIVRRTMPASRILTVPANSWFAWGPALVLVLARDSSPDGRFGILLLALAAQFVCDFAANAVREHLLKGLALRELAGEMGQIYLIDLALAPLGLVVAFAAVSHPWAVLLIAPLFGVLMRFSQERHVRLEQLVELNDAYRGTALVLGDVVEADDTYTGEHCKGVVLLALDVARELGLDADQRRKVEFAALLHDIGKIAVPKEIVNKPGKLDDREWAIIRTHTLEGQKMLERVGGFMSEVGEIVRASHESWDGRGYPDRLRGREIPLEARIVACCDAFNAMTTTRPYRKAMPVSAALTELVDSAGTQFDPQVVETLLRVIERPGGAPTATDAGTGVKSLPTETALELSVESATAQPAAERKSEDERSEPPARSKRARLDVGERRPAAIEGARATSARVPSKRS